MRTALPLAVLILGTPVSLAQVPGVPNTMNSFQPLGAVTGTPFGRGTVLDADGDSLADIFFLHGTHIEGVFAPGVFMSFYDDIGYANDVARLPGAIGAPDALLSVSSGGLKSLEFVRDENVTSWTPTNLVPGGWGGAQRVDCRVLNGETWIFGLQADSKAVRACADLGTGWTEGALFTTTFNVTEIGAMDYQGDGYLDVALVGGSRWEIWSRNGSPFNPWTRAASGVQSGTTLLDLAVGAQSGNSAEWVAFLASGNETPDRSFVIVRDSAGTQAPEEIASQPDAIAIEAGDISGDGNDDLVFSIRADAAMLVSVNQSDGSSPAFDGTRFVEPPLTPPTLTFEIPIVADDFEQNTAHPLVADFDNDFDLDFCLALEPEGYTQGMMYVHRDPLTGPGPDPSPVLEVLKNSCEGITVKDSDLGDCEDNCLLLQARANSSAAPFEAVEAFLWVKDSGEDHTQPDSVCWVQKPNSGSTPIDHDLYMGLLSNPGLLDDAPPRDDTIYYFMICFAELNASNQVTAIFRPQVYGFQSQCESGSTECGAKTLLSTYASGPVGEVNSYGCSGSPNCGPPDGPGIWTGSYVPVPCIPQLPANDPPQLLRTACSNPCD
jgi:hypothetical protein